MFYQILGIILIAFGTFLTFYGSSIKSKQDNKTMQFEFKAKYDEVISKIDSLKFPSQSDQYNGEINSTKSDVDAIENDYLKWADQFFSNIESTQLEDAKYGLGKKEKEIELSRKYRSVYICFLDQVKSFIDAYNQRSEVKITYTFPTLPPNIYNAEEQNYLSEIRFNKEVIWAVFISGGNALEGDIPRIIISRSDKNGIESAKKEDLSFLHLHSILTIHFDMEGNELRLWKKDENVRGLAEEYPFEDYEKSFEEIIEKYVSRQLFVLFHKKP
ncbi:hypothetical protein HQ587_03875 [bacterium]|nr:hypothetical protein [bacterium]